MNKIHYFWIILLICSCAQESKDKVQQYELQKKKGTCYFFFIADCPASQNSLPKVQRLYDKYYEYGIEFIGIVSDPDIDDKILNDILVEKEVTFEIVEDENLVIASKHNATVNPQVFLYDENSNLIYSGLVDDYYIELGKHRNRAKVNYLESAIINYLKGQVIIDSITTPIGCAINFN